MIQSLRQEIEQEQRLHLLHTLELCEAFLFAVLGQKERMPQWIAEGDFQSSHLLFPAMGFLNIVYGRVLLINGEYNRLLGGMDWFMETASVFPNLLSQIYARIYEAAAYEKLLMREHTLCALKAALDMAIPDHLLMPFVENCDFIKPALNELSHHTEYMDVISTILTLYAPYQQGIERYVSKRIPHSNTELTGRENEIAKLVAQGLSNSEIAGRLYISTNTVKTMLKRIFEKLAINSRAMLKQHMDLQNQWVFVTHPCHPRGDSIPKLIHRTIGTVDFLYKLFRRAHANRYKKVSNISILTHSAADHWIACGLFCNRLGGSFSGNASAASDSAGSFI